MNNYIVPHKFRSLEMKEAFAIAGEGRSDEDQIKGMTGDNAACQMSCNKVLQISRADSAAKSSACGKPPSRRLRFYLHQ